MDGKNISGLGQDRLQHTLISTEPFCLILIKDLIRVLQNRVNDLDLPAGIRDGGAGVGAHECGTEDDGEVV